MRSQIYRATYFDASHRLLHYKGKCARIHGHRWRVEVWLEGEADEKTGILVDYAKISEVIERFDHQLILNRDDPLVPILSPYQEVITTEGDPTSERLACSIRKLLDETCAIGGICVQVIKVRVWESETCYAEVTNESC